MFSAYSPRAANAYQRINVETSMHTMDQHQLVSLLYEGILNAIATARGAMARGDVLAKVNAISKAVRILEEGLSTSLDKVDGGELAENLGALYDYCMRRLILANARNDDAMMLEVMRLIEPVAEGWNAIKKTGQAAPAAGATASFAATPGQPVLMGA
jgi:flagellar protein FliS